MGDQRNAAVAVPCCTTAIPACAGYISSRHFITWSAWLLYERVTASCEDIDPQHPLIAGRLGNLIGSYKIFKCYNDNNVCVCACECECVCFNTFLLNITQAQWLNVYAKQNSKRQLFWGGLLCRIYLFYFIFCNVSVFMIKKFSIKNIILTMTFFAYVSFTYIPKYI